MLIIFQFVVCLILLCPIILRKNCYKLKFLLLCAICEISLSLSHVFISSFIYTCWFESCIPIFTWQQGQSPHTLASEQWLCRVLCLTRLCPPSEDRAHSEYLVWRCFLYCLVGADHGHNTFWILISIILTFFEINIIIFIL